MSPLALGITSFGAWHALKGNGDWVTSTPTTEEQATAHPDKVITAIKERGSPHLTPYTDFGSPNTNHTSFKVEMSSTP